MMESRIIAEPELQFCDGVHVDIRAGMGSYGALDRGAPAVPVPIRVGIVGSSETVGPLREWLSRCMDGVESDDGTEFRPSFPGVSDAVYGTRIEFARATTRSVPKRALERALRGKSLDTVVELFLEHARDLAGRGTLNVLIIAPPVSVFELGQVFGGRPEELDEGADEEEVLYRPCFHDLFKARALDLLVPCQMIRPDTYGAGSTRKHRRRPGRLQDEATRAWNFFTALYYKAGLVPWRLVRDPASLSACFVGISFFRTVDQERVLASVAQVFDERGEGVIVQSGNARIDKDDRSPHLTPDDAGRLVSDALAAYRREHRTFPARVVVHKTSYFDADERESIVAVADDLNIDVAELVSVRRGGLRLFRPAYHPPLRGTVLLFDERCGAVYLRGSVPQFQMYPGMYVPTTLEFERAHGEMNSEEVAAELLALSKLNFNSTQFDNGEPITVRAARRVGDILKHVDPDREVQSRFRYFT